MIRLFIVQALILALIAFLYLYLGLREGFVFTVFWYDILLHILGGFWSALAIAWFFSVFGVRLSFFQLFSLVLLIGISWEAFEYIFGIGGSNFMSYEVDTVKDTINDLIGGVLGAALVRKLFTLRIETSP